MNDGEPLSCEVGYKRPPLHSRFQPGKSGNPRGRPRRKRAIESIVDDLLGQKMWVTLDGRKKRVPVEEAILLRVREQALKGDQKAVRLLLDLKRGFAPVSEPGPAADELSQEDLAILACAGMLLTKQDDGDGGP